MRKLHLVMPMGGKGSRFSKYGYEYPKPLLEIQGKPFFYWATQSIAKFIDVIDITFVVLQEHIDKYDIDKHIKKYYPEAIIHVIPEVLNGAVLTCQEGLQEIKDNNPILFNDCDHIFRCRSFEEFCKEGLSDQVNGALLTFQSNENKYSFVRLDDEENVIETVEKKVISSQAICGCYYFGDKQIFHNAVKQYMNECAYTEYYVSGLYNVMVENGAKVKAFETDFHVPFGIPEEYEEAKTSEHFTELL